MFIEVTVTDIETNSTPKKSIGKVKCLYKTKDISHIQEYNSGTSLLYLEKGTMLYVTESLAEIKLLLEKADKTVTSLLFGK